MRFYAINTIDLGKKNIINALQEAEHYVLCICYMAFGIDIYSMAIKKNVQKINQEAINKLGGWVVTNDRWNWLSRTNFMNKKFVLNSTTRPMFRHPTVIFP